MNLDELELRIRDGVEDSEDLWYLLSAARERDRFAGYIAELHGMLGRGTHSNAEQDYRCAISGIADLRGDAEELSRDVTQLEEERDRLQLDVRECHRIAGIESDESAAAIVSRQDAAIARLVEERDRLREDLYEARLLLARATGTCIGVRRHVPTDHPARWACDECAEACKAFLDRRPDEANAKTREVAP